MQIFFDGFEQMILPEFQRIHEKLERFDAIEAQLGRMDRKLNAVIDRLDDHGVRIKRLESHLI